MIRGRASVVTSALLALALLALGITTAVAMLAIAHANDRVLQARVVVTAYINLEHTVAGEAFAEASYRRAPDAAARTRLYTAMSAVPTEIAAVRDVGDKDDGAVLSYVATLNRRYVAEVRATLDTTRGDRLDDRVAGPALDAMQQVLDAALDGHRTEAKTAVVEQARVIQRLGIVLAAVFVLAFAVLGFAWRIMLREQRRLAREADDHRTRSLTDPLTGLPNRSGLHAAMDIALGRPRTESALLYLDLDRFKPVNDTLGHAAGDAVLREVAARLEASIRAGEVAARLGGDEFAVFLPRGRDAVHVAERILAAFREPFAVDGHLFDVGTSIGLARSPGDGEDSESLLSNADAALYEAKRAGRGRVEVSRAAAPVAAS